LTGLELLELEVEFDEDEELERLVGLEHRLTGLVDLTKKYASNIILVLILICNKMLEF